MSATKLVADGTVAELKLQEFLPYRMALSADEIARALSVICEPFGLSIGEWMVLAAVSETPNLTSKAIGVRCNMHKTKMSRAVSALERRNLISRSTNRMDMREVLLRLTPQGHGLYAQCAPPMVNFLRRLDEAMDASDRDALERCLARLSELSCRLIADPFGAQTRQHR